MIPGRRLRTASRRDRLVEGDVEEVVHVAPACLNKRMLSLHFYEKKICFVWMDRLLVFHQIFDKELNVHGFLNHEFPFIFASLICIHIFISKNHPSLCCDLVKARPSTGKPGWLRLWMIKYAWLANEVSATDNTPLCANLCKFLTDTLIKSRQSLTEIRACKHVIVCIVHTEATRTYKE